MKPTEPIAWALKRIDTIFDAARPDPVTLDRMWDIADEDDDLVDEWLTRCTDCDTDIERADDGVCHRCQTIRDRDFSEAEKWDTNR